MHYGTDYARGEYSGKSIYSVAAGTVRSVVASNATSGSGNAITIGHANGYSSVYMHMLRRSPLNEGAQVTAGQVIGQVGSTGGSTGAHLHLEIRLNGNAIDPHAFLQGAPLANRVTSAPQKRRRRYGDDEMPIIYHALGQRTQWGILASNGGWVELRNQEEYNNLIKAGVKAVWIERLSLDNMIADARS